MKRTSLLLALLASLFFSLAACSTAATPVGPTPVPDIPFPEMPPIPVVSPTTAPTAAPVVAKPGDEALGSCVAGTPSDLAKAVYRFFPEEYPIGDADIAVALALFDCGINDQSLLWDEDNDVLSYSGDQSTSGWKFIELATQGAFPDKVGPWTLKKK